MPGLNLRVIYTGGTIGSVGTPLGPLTGERFAEAFQALVTPTIMQRYPQAQVSFSWLDPTLDSTNLQPSDWVRIANEILKEENGSSVYAQHDAFLVLHGTDTMAWTASALSFLLTGLDAAGQHTGILSKPVIVTGSQLPLFYEAEQGGDLSLLYDTDALRNVLGAVACARAGLPEVGLFFHDTLMRGNRTLKTNASDFDAFTSPNYPALAGMGIELTLHNPHILPAPSPQAAGLDNPAALAALTEQLAYIGSTIDASDVVNFLAYPAQYNPAASPSPTSALARALAGAISGDGDVGALFLGDYGEGNFPSGDPGDPESGAIYDVLKTAHDAGMIIASGTQVIEGTVNSTAYASGAWMADAGCISTYDMSGPAIQAKLIYLLALRNYQDRNWDQATIEDLMRTPIAGELMGVNRLDSRRLGHLLPGQAIQTFDGSARLLNDPVSGPVILDRKDQALWTAPIGPAALPGRLVMQEDGALVFLDRTDSAAWIAGLSPAPGAYSALILEGSADAGTLSLVVYDYANDIVSPPIWSQGG
jgi:L-asparaginase